MAGQTINVSILADTKQFSSAMDEISSPNGGLGRLGGMAKMAGGAVVAGLAAASAAIVGLGVKSVGLASDLEQSMGGVDAVFKDVAGQVHDFASKADTALGLSKNSYNELATVIGTTLKNSGTPLEELASVTDTLIGRSSDLAATFGGPVTDASNAMASALRGEFEPLRKYGVSLNQADINARALADSGKTAASELTKQEKALATQALIMEQSTDAAGAFARESDTLAGQTERLKAQLENLGASAGTVLLPILTSIVGWVTGNVVPALKDFGGAAQQLWGIFTQGNFKGGPLSEDSKVVDIAFRIRDALVEMAPKAQAAFEALQNGASRVMEVLGPIVSQIIGVFQSAFGGDAGGEGIGGIVSKAATMINEAVTMIGTILSAAANMITVVWSAVGPTVLAVISNVFETIKGIVSGAMDVIEGIIKTVTAVLTGDWSGAWEGIKQIVSGALTIVTTIISSAFNQVRIIAGAIWEGIKAAISAAWDGITGAVSRGVDTVISWVQSLPSRAADALSNIGTALLNAGGRLIDGFIDGIKSGFDRVRSKLSELTSLLPDWKGPAGRDATLLTNAGRLVIGGFIDGMESQYGAVRSSLAGLTATVADTPVASPTLDVAYAGTGYSNQRPSQGSADFDYERLARTMVAAFRNGGSFEVGVTEVAGAVARQWASRRH